MALREFRLPDPGEGLVEADIVTWRVAVGDTIKVNDIVVEVETSKSLVELPSPYAGTVAALLVAEGDTVDVGVPIIRIEDGTAAPAVPAPAAPAAPPPPPAAESGEDGATPGGRVPVLVGYGPRTGEVKRRPRKSSAADPDPHEFHAELAGTFDTRPRCRAGPTTARRCARTSTSRSGRRCPGPARRRASRWPAGVPCWPNPRCANWPRTSGSTWTAWTAADPVA